jgi:hypothetical protein
MPEQVPEVLLAPDVAVLERAVRERPDVAAAVLSQMHYSTANGSVTVSGEGEVNPVEKAADKETQKAPDDPESPVSPADRDGAPDRVGGDRP